MLTHRPIVVRAPSVVSSTYRTFLASVHHRPEWSNGTASPHKCHLLLPGDDIAITQELIAHMLGVRRESVTDAVHKLQKLDLVQWRRGHISVLDRRGLELRACECYLAVRKEYERLLPGRQQAAAKQRATSVCALRPVCSLAH